MSFFCDAVAAATAIQPRSMVVCRCDVVVTDAVCMAGMGKNLHIRYVESAFCRQRLSLASPRTKACCCVVRQHYSFTGSMQLNNS